MNIYIYTNSYDANSGGAVVLHRLCHIVNKYSEHNAYLVKLNPFYYGKRSFKKYLSKLKWHFVGKYKFKINPNWNTPVWEKIQDIPSNSVAIYPEIINGNPLKITNVVRWLLHQPGHHTGIIDYGENELYSKFNSAIKDFQRQSCLTSENELKVIYYPIDIYTHSEDVEKDIETCYLVRKGFNKPCIHSADAIKIDGLDHYQTANIFRRSRKFISYDDYTAYSIFSILCGCESYVVPGDGQSVTDWYPNIEDRYGISYGFSDEQIKWAEETKGNVYKHILKEHEKSIARVNKCLSEIINHFSIAN